MKEEGDANHLCYDTVHIVKEQRRDLEQVLHSQLPVALQRETPT